MKFLFTGFDPFGENSINPSSMAVEALPDRIGENEIVKLFLPTSYKNAPKLLMEAINEYSPDIVICVGLAGGRKDVSLEFCALNIADSSLPDNDGVVKSMDRVIPVSGENAHFCHLFLDRAARALNEQGIPCKVSFNAGTYVCNTLYFHLLEACYHKPDMKGLFVHIPFLPEQAEQQKFFCPSMTLEEDVRALTALVEFFGNK